MLVAALGAGIALVASALAASSLVSISATCPYERVGTTAPIATVNLDSAADSDTTVSLTSSQTSVATVPSSVTVPAGQSSALVQVTALAQGETTLSATLGATVREVSVRIGGAAEEPEIPALSLAPPSVSAGGSSTATVILDFIAPAGGTRLTLASDNPGVTVPSELVIPADQCSGTFVVHSTSAATGVADITATLGAHSAMAPLTVSPAGSGEPPAPPTTGGEPTQQPVTGEVPPTTGAGSSAASAGTSPSPPPVASGPTGKRAAALRRCRRTFRHAKAKRARCLKKARSLPL